MAFVSQAADGKVAMEGGRVAGGESDWERTALCEPSNSRWETLHRNPLSGSAERACSPMQT